MSSLRYHRVEPGEQLVDLAKHYYGKGTPQLALVIYQHNRDKIEDPNQIYPGQDICIPHLRPHHVL